MHRDGPGDLRRIADALFRALDRLGPGVYAGSLDLSGVDTLTSQADVDHLVLQGKLCSQRLYNLGARPSDYDQDMAFVLVSTIDLVVREVGRAQPGDSDELRRLNDAWEQLRDLTMELERRYAGEQR